MKAIALPQNLLETVIAQDIKIITLQFSGGSDEGYLNVEVEGGDGSLNDEIEAWADTAYEYSGAGDGNDYGDDITYDFKNRTVTTSTWCMERHDDKPETMPLEEI